MRFPAANDDMPAVIEDLSTGQLLDLPHGVHYAHGNIVKWSLNGSRNFSPHYKPVLVALLLNEDCFCSGAATIRGKNAVYLCQLITWFPVWLEYRQHFTICGEHAANELARAEPLNRRNHWKRQTGGTEGVSNREREKHRNVEKTPFLAFWFSTFRDGNSMRVVCNFSSGILCFTDYRH